MSKSPRNASGEWEHAHQLYMLAGTADSYAVQQPAQEAVTLYRELSATNPDSYISDLARCLNNLGSILYGLGRKAEALPAIEEAVTLRRDLAESSPDLHRSDLAHSLANLGPILAALDTQRRH